MLREASKAKPTLILAEQITKKKNHHCIVNIMIRVCVFVQIVYLELLLASGMILVIIVMFSLFNCGFVVILTYLSL